ncbi:3125_t:CDS:2, partial [Scutellospora calospora]
VGPKFILFDDLEAVKFILKDSNMPKTPTIAGIRAHQNLPTLFSATDKKFHKQRKHILSPAFSIKYVASLEPLIQSCVKSLIKKIDSLSKPSTKSLNSLNSESNNIFNEDNLPFINLY